MITDLLQPTHLIIVLAVALLVLGPKRLPDAGRALGQGLREFRQSITASHDHDPDSTPGMLPGDTEIPAR
jgi:sec-independent protein translocase protein TatA